MNIYRMSSVGCQRAIAAEKLGYEPMPETGDSKILLEEATEDENRVIDRLLKQDISLEISGEFCPKCYEEFGDTRRGIHVELTTPLLRIIGHLDGNILFNNSKYPFEIKNLGRFTFDKFRRNQFVDFPEYEAQEALYLAATNSSGIYAVRCRDNGRMLVYAVGDGIPDELVEKLQQVEASEFGRLSKPDADRVLDKLNWVELCVRDGELPQGEFEEGSNVCRWCRFKFLCLREEKEEKDIKTESLPNLTEAAGWWREGKELQRQAEDRLEAAKNIFLNHTKSSGVNKFKVSGVSVSYLGQKQRQYLDEEKLKSLVDENILKQAYKLGKSWEDIRIRLLSEKI